jgi:hypothetical protein
MLSQKIKSVKQKSIRLFLSMKSNINGLVSGKNLKWGGEDETIDQDHAVPGHAERAGG